MLEETGTLEDMLRSYPEGTLFNDGATTWDAPNLIDAYYETEEGKRKLQQKVYATETGIYTYKQDGYLEAIPFLTVTGQDQS